MNLAATEAPKPYEQFWNIEATPFTLKSRADMRCIMCAGPMVVSHGVYFEFELNLHKDHLQKSHAMDTWTRCHFCGWTTVHGVALPNEKFQAIADVVSKGQRIDGDGQEIEPDPDEERLNKGTIYPMSQEEPMDKQLAPTWEATESEKGLTPLIPMTCKSCGPWIREQQALGRHTDVKLHENGEVPMILRHSRQHLVHRSQGIKRLRIFKFEIIISKPIGKTFTIPAFRISYKCPVCDWLSTFVCPVPQDYFDKILELRGGEALYYPPLEDWGKDADFDLVKEKLESLGYV